MGSICKVFSGCLLEHLRKPGSLFPLNTQVSSASVYSNRGENSTGKMLENMIVKLQTMTGGLIGGKSLHNFVFNGLYLILKRCLPLPFKKGPIYKSRMRGCRVRASKDSVGISPEYLQALRIHWSHLCSPQLKPPVPGSVGPLLPAGVRWLSPGTVCVPPQEQLKRPFQIRCFWAAAGHGAAGCPFQLGTVLKPAVRWPRRGWLGQCWEEYQWCPPAINCLLGDAVSMAAGKCCTHSLTALTHPTASCAGPRAK